MIIQCKTYMTNIFIIRIVMAFPHIHLRSLQSRARNSKQASLSRQFSPRRQLILFYLSTEHFFPMARTLQELVVHRRPAALEDAGQVRDRRYLGQSPVVLLLATGVMPPEEKVVLCVRRVMASTTGFGCLVMTVLSK
jgi:hypothetical protein